MYNCNYYCLTVLLVLLQLDLWAAKRGKLKHHHEIYLISTKRITTPHKTKEIIKIKTFIVHTAFIRGFLSQGST